MGDHLIDGEFQSDKYPTTPRGCVPLKPSDPTAQDLLWQYAQRRRDVDPEFASDLEHALTLKGFDPSYERPYYEPKVEDDQDLVDACAQLLSYVASVNGDCVFRDNHRHTTLERLAHARTYLNAIEKYVRDASKLGGDEG